MTPFGKLIFRNWAIMLIIGLLVGIETTDLVAQTPDPLEVEGIIYSKQGGIRFPDSTVQTSAAYQSETNAAAEGRSFVLMRIRINGNDLKGPYMERGFEETFVIHHIFQETNVPFDTGAGRTTGSRIVGPFTLIKEIDDQSPLFQKAISQGENVDELVLYFLSDNGMGGPTTYYSITLTDGRLIKMTNELHYQGNGQYAHLHQIVAIAEKILYKDEINGNEFEDQIISPAGSVH